MVARLNASLQAVASVAGAFPAAHLDLHCPMAAGLDGAPALTVEEAWRAAWASARRGDAEAGLTRAGPHRADLQVTHVPKGQPASACSTGEQKALLISVILAHAGLIAAMRGFAPLLLLDEVAAHLDAPRREALFAALAALPGQVFLTGTDHGLFAPLRGAAQGFRARPGELIPVPL
jgi:DNA replication and repair protein RecF